MSTRLALVMHDPLGKAFQACARHVLGREPALQVFDIHPDASPAAELSRIMSWLQSESTRRPVLMLCDLYGATPFNIAVQACEQASRLGFAVNLLTGTNACMVLKALTDQHKSPASLSESVRLGALRGIVSAGSSPDIQEPDTCP